MGLIAYIIRLFHILSNVSQNKTEQIKCNDINKNSILPPNNVVSQKQLWLEPIDHFKDVNNNKGVGTLLRMSGPFLNLRSVKTSTYFLSLAKTQVTVFKKNKIK